MSVSDIFENMEHIPDEYIVLGYMPVVINGIVFRKYCVGPQGQIVSFYKDPKGTLLKESPQVCFYQDGKCHKVSYKKVQEQGKGSDKLCKELVKPNMSLERAIQLIKVMDRNDGKGPLAEGTKTNYINRTKRIFAVGINPFTDTEAEIIKKVCGIENCTYARYHDDLGVIFRLRKAVNLPYEEIRDVMSDEDYWKDQCVDPVEPEVKAIATKEQLEDHLQSVYEKEDWISYIINFILFYINTRNMDLDLLLVKEEPKDKNDNYIWIKEGEVVYYRNKYKTVETYGPRKHVIKHEAFQYACETLYEEREDCGSDKRPLLVNLRGSNKGKRLGPGSIALYIRSRTYQEVGEGSIFKTLLTAAVESGKGSNILKMAKNRGTDAQTCLEYYDRS